MIDGSSSIELEGFERVEVAPGTVLLRIAARDCAPVISTRTSILIVDDGRRSHRLSPLPGPASPAGLLRVAYSAPAELLEGRTAFSLELSDGSVVRLPPPTRGLGEAQAAEQSGRADRLVRELQAATTEAAQLRGRASQLSERLLLAEAGAQEAEAGTAELTAEIARVRAESEQRLAEAIRTTADGEVARTADARAADAKRRVIELEAAALEARQATAAIEAEHTQLLTRTEQLGRELEEAETRASTERQLSAARAEELASRLEATLTQVERMREQVAAADTRAAGAEREAVEARASARAQQTEQNQLEDRAKQEADEHAAALTATAEQPEPAPRIPGQQEQAPRTPEQRGRRARTAEQRAREREQAERAQRERELAERKAAQREALRRARERQKAERGTARQRPVRWPQSPRQPRAEPAAEPPPSKKEDLPAAASVGRTPGREAALVRSPGSRLAPTQTTRPRPARGSRERKPRRQGATRMPSDASIGILLLVLGLAAAVLILTGELKLGLAP